ncbi:MAG: hypothetical protein EAZ16_07140 [Sphingobacteriales bacterium]|nr:MAG: hypothetical protein EAZ16_07140 [Sphingobacteriales bacterium]
MGIFFLKQVAAQTEVDAIMMNKNQFCSGFMYNHSSWKDYWEGTLKRNNLNIGTVSTQSVMAMANYGITNNLNVMIGAPYIWTKASAGTLTGVSGVQDAAAFIKWRAINKSFGKHKLALYAVGGVSTPLADYVKDFLPLSIGLGASTASARVIADYKYNNFVVTGSAAFVRRSNITLDRNSYYDTQLRLTDEVNMPDAANFQLRTGYRGKYLIAEALLTNFTTLGGFDITRNNMPFPSNRMNATMVGANIKYTLPKMTNLSLLGGFNYTLAGRNVGQTTSINIGAFYAFYFGKKGKK